MRATAEIWEACWHVSRPELHVRSRDVSRVTEVWICAIEFNVKSPLTSQLQALTLHELTWREDSVSPALGRHTGPDDTAGTVTCPVIRLSCRYLWGGTWYAARIIRCSQLFPSKTGERNAQTKCSTAEQWTALLFFLFFWYKSISNYFFLNPWFRASWFNVNKRSNLMQQSWSGHVGRK